MNRNQLNLLDIKFILFSSSSDMDLYLRNDIPINQFLFDKQLLTLNTALIDVDDGLILTKSLIPHENLRNIHFTLQTIDDLYVLLDGLVPSVETMSIHLRQRRILSK